MMSREHHRRRSPESSRRRRRERRDSREQLQTLSTSSSSSSTSSSLLNISAPSRKFGLRSFFSSGGSRKHRRRVKKRRSGFLRFRNSSSSSVGSDLAYGKGYIDRRRSREFSPPSPHAPRRSSDRERPSVPKRTQTDAEIIELGRQFAVIARQQNVEDFRASGRVRPSTLTGTATALSQFHPTGGGNVTRGIASSRTVRDSSPDDSEWESASDEDSSSEEDDSGLVYGIAANFFSSPSKPAYSRASPQYEQASNPETPLSRNPSLADPKLFGPVNSLRGYVQTPFGFERTERIERIEHTSPSVAASGTVVSTESRPLQQVYPVPTSDPARFDAGRGSIVSSHRDSPTHSRPAPVPIQQPQPIAPVSPKVFESGDVESRYSRRSSSGSILAKAAAAGVAGAAIGAVLSSERERDRKDRREEDHEHRYQESKRRSEPPRAHDYEERPDKRRSHDDGRNERRRASTFEPGQKHEKDKRRKEKNPPHSDQFRGEGSGSWAHDQHHDELKEDAEKSQTYQHLEGVPPPPSRSPLDVFQYQGPLTPNIPPQDEIHAPERLTRRDTYERELPSAHDTLEDAQHATALVGGAAMAAATAAVLRGGDRTSRTRGDSPQQRADRVYREEHLARRIEEDEKRSRSNSPEPSVIDKWKQHEDMQDFGIVPPPEIDPTKQKSPYDGPDADVRVDNL
ncbi:hypothetical protein F4780DRAFT_770823 [Xylariomycetidae sp. FL0641]|nr:hypothetical protein F4780DRAFT_770823 [Xylariomycetidae sp. FL0641]